MLAYPMSMRFTSTSVLFTGINLSNRNEKCNYRKPQDHGRPKQKRNLEFRHQKLKQTCKQVSEPNTSRLQEKISQKEHKIKQFDY